MKIGVQENLTETQTNDNGEATLDVDLKRFTNSTYRLSVLAQVFEAGGGRNVQADNNVLGISISDRMPCSQSWTCPEVLLLP